MNTLAIIASVNAALNLVTSALPLIDQLKQNGQITPEQQQELLAKYNSLKAQADGQFSGPAWQV